jgi:hypothetical protein
MTVEERISALEVYLKELADMTGKAIISLENQVQVLNQAVANKVVRRPSHEQIISRMESKGVGWEEASEELTREMNDG